MEKHVRSLNEASYFQLVISRMGDSHASRRSFRMDQSLRSVRSRKTCPVERWTCLEHPHRTQALLHRLLNPFARSMLSGQTDRFPLHLFPSNGDVVRLKRRLHKRSFLNSTVLRGLSASRMNWQVYPVQGPTDAKAMMRRGRNGRGCLSQRPAQPRSQT